MGLILDSSLLVAHERRRFDLAAFLLPRGNDPVAISVVTLSELLHGWHRAVDSKIKEERGRFIAAVRRDYVVIAFGEPQAESHARVWAELETAGNRIGAHDLQIAATALSLDYDLATFNDREFTRVPGLHVIKPLLSGGD